MLVGKASATSRAVASIRRASMHRKISTFFLSLCLEEVCLQTSLLSFLQRGVALKQSVFCWMIVYNRASVLMWHPLV